MSNGLFCFSSRTPTIPRDLDSRTSITIDDKTFSIEADDLESLCVLGRGAYGVVEKVKHKQTDTVLAVKVRKVFADLSVVVVVCCSLCFKISLGQFKLKLILFSKFCCLSM